MVYIADTMKREEKPCDMAAASFTSQEYRLIELLRQLEYGEMRVVVKNSAIVQIEEKKSIKL